MMNVIDPFATLEIERTEELKKVIKKFSDVLESLKLSESENLLMIDSAKELLLSAEKSGFVFGVTIALKSTSST